MRDIYLLRHARPDTDDVRRYLGQSDPPLGSVGRSQAERLRERFQHIPLEAIYTSDLRRCRETAETIASGRALPVIPRRDLREIDMGDWEGVPMAHIAQTQPETYRARGQNMAHFAPPNGESFADVAHRALSAWNEITRESPTSIAIVAHAGWNRALMCTLLGMPLQRLFILAQDYACINHIQMTDNDNVRLITLNAPLQKD